MNRNFKIKNLNDDFQSTYLLETLLENFDQYPEIIREAKNLLIEVVKITSEKNSSFQSNTPDNE